MLFSGVRYIMDTMVQEGENLKDSQMGSNISIKDSPFFMSYNKTNKLVTALYMVTDVMDKEEPLRNKLRSLGSGIISDIYLLQTPLVSDISLRLDSKISEVLSFLDIASAVGMISAMNCNILKKEFFELKASLKESRQSSSLSEFLIEELPSPDENKFLPERLTSSSRAGIGQHGMRIGVQKGSTLMKALSDKTLAHSVRSQSNLSNKNSNDSIKSIDSFNILKKQRREEILAIVKDKKEVTISDIKARARGVLVSCGEKTLQRELISMVKEGILERMGEKRWSRYFLPK